MKKRLLFAIPLITLLAVSCSGNGIPNSITFTFDELGDNVDFHTELQSKYINAEDYTNTNGIASGSSEKSAPQGVTITWSEKKNGKDPDWYDVLVGVDGYERSVGEVVKERSATIQNLYLGATYHISLIAHYDSSPKNEAKLIMSDKFTFTTTNKGPRNLSYENVMNIRDLGGHGIKQGLIYRSARFSESDGTTLLSSGTIERMSHELGLKTEIDLRRRDENGEITQSPLGEEVHYYHLPMIYGGENILTYVGDHSSGHYDNPVEIKNFFNILADESNYPLDFHCSIGKDRTGCMAYLIEALCGMSEEDIYRDYLFSNFAKISGICEMKDIDDRYGKTINEYEGTNLQEKTYNYLNNVVGIEKDKINSVISILKA